MKSIWKYWVHVVGLSGLTVPEHSFNCLILIPNWLFGNQPTKLLMLQHPEYWATFFLLKKKWFWNVLACAAYFVWFSNLTINVSSLFCNWGGYMYHLIMSIDFHSHSQTQFIFILTKAFDVKMQHLVYLLKPSTMTLCQQIVKICKHPVHQEFWFLGVLPCIVRRWLTRYAYIINVNYSVFNSLFWPF